MSSLSRNPGLRGAGALLGTVALFTAPGLRAQELSFVPFAQVTGEWDTNRLLLTNNAQSGEWGEGRIGANFERDTVQSTLAFRPQVSFQDSSYKALTVFQAQMDARGTYRTQLTTYTAGASFVRQDAYNAEYGLAEFNPYNPGQPDTVGTGVLLTGVTRTSYNISPDVTHQFTQRVSGELNGSFTGVNYSTDIPQELVSFKSPYIEADAVYAVSQRSQVSVGPYYQEYIPNDSLQDGVLKSNAYGANLGYRFLSSELTRSNLTLKVGRISQDQFVGPSTTVTSWGLEWTGTYNTELSHLQYSIGRFLQPSSVGGQVSLNQIRIAYEKSMTRRLAALVAFRVTREDQLAQSDSGHRDRAYGDASLRYSLSRYWDLTGGYRFAWQKLPPESQNAFNNGVYITIGVHGLAPQR